MFKRWMVYTPDQFRKLYHSHQQRSKRSPK
jgi:hypothetical protein